MFLFAGSKWQLAVDVVLTSLLHPAVPLSKQSLVPAVFMCLLTICESDYDRMFGMYNIANILLVCLLTTGRSDYDRVSARASWDVYWYDQGSPFIHKHFVRLSREYPAYVMCWAGLVKDVSERR